MTVLQFVILTSFCSFSCLFFCYCPFYHFMCTECVCVCVLLIKSAICMYVCMCMLQFFAGNVCIKKKVYMESGKLTKIMM